MNKTTERQSSICLYTIPADLKSNSEDVIKAMTFFSFSPVV